MAVSAQFREHLVDLLAPLGAIDTRHMFGGLSLRCDGQHFGVLIKGTFYLVADDGLRAELAAMGGRIFSYARRDRMVDVPRFVSVPEDLMEDPDALLPYARRALAVARGGEALTRRGRPA